MDTRVAVISIIVEQEDAIEELNTLLHEARQYIVGRMGIPYRPKGISIISIAIDAPQDVISALSGKIGRLKGVSAKRHTRMLLLRQREEQIVIKIAVYGKVESENPPRFPMWQRTLAEMGLTVIQIGCDPKQIPPYSCVTESRFLPC